MPTQQVTNPQGTPKNEEGAQTITKLQAAHYVMHELRTHKISMIVYGIAVLLMALIHGLTNIYESMKTPLIPFSVLILVAIYWSWTWVRNEKRIKEYTNKYNIK